MNQFTIAVLVLVVFCYWGGKYCPSVLKQNKQILLGVVGGLVLCSFLGMKLEGGPGTRFDWNMFGHGFAKGRPEDIRQHREALTDEATRNDWKDKCCGNDNLDKDHKCHHEGFMESLGVFMEYAEHWQNHCQ
mgnify:CR=1 FL=1